MCVFLPQKSNYEVKNGEKGPDRLAHAAFAAKNHLNLLQIVVIDKWKHLLIP